MRIRLVNPAAPKDEAFARCSVHARLAFVLLPCHADRAGRLEDKPFQLRLDIFPTDHQVDMEAVLGELARAELIVRYQVQGARYIQIRTFGKHQKPHRNEAVSRIPPAPDSVGRTNDLSPSTIPAAQRDNVQSLREHSGDRDLASASLGGDPEGARAFQISSSLLLPSEADPDPERAIPGHWLHPGQEEVTYHHAVARARPAPPGVRPPGVNPREAPGLRAQRLVDTFGRVRSEVAEKHGQGAVPWHHGPGDFAKAVEFVEWLDGKGGAVTVGEVERTMRAHLEWAVRQPERKHFEVGWSFGTWKHRFSDWLEEVRGQRQPELPGLTDKDRKNVANMQRWYDRKEEQSREPQDIRR